MEKEQYIKRSAARYAVLHNEGDAARAAIERIPAEDVVPVVWCGECTYQSKKIKPVKGLIYCDYHKGIRQCTDFCNKGIRIEP